MMAVAGIGNLAPKRLFMENKKKIYIAVTALVVVLLAAVGIYALSGTAEEQEKKDKKKSKYSDKVCLADNYIDALPANPVAIVRVQADRLLEKSELLSNSDFNRLYSDFKDIFPENLQANVDAFLADPSSAGVDITRPVYAGVYMNGVTEMVAAVPLSDKQRLIEVMMSVLTDLDYEVVEEEGGLCYIVDNYGKRFPNVVFDNKTLLCTPYADVMKFVQSSGSGLSSDEAYSTLFASGSDVAMAADIDNILSIYGDSVLKGPTGKAVSNILAGSRIDATVDFVNGGVDGVAELKLQPKYAPIAGIIKGATGKHIKYMPDNAVAIYNFKADINVLYNMLPTLIDGVSDISVIDNAMEMFGIDKSFINRLSTEFSLAVLPSAKVGKEYGPRFVIAMDNPDKEIFNFVLNFIGKENLEKIGADAYALGLNKYATQNRNGKVKTSVAGYDYCLAYNNGTMFLIPVDVYRSKVVSSSSVGNAWFKELGGKELCVNTTALDRCGFVLPDYVQKFMDFMQIGTLTVEFDDISKMKMHLDVQEKGCNVLKLATDTFFKNFLSLILPK